MCHFQSPNIKYEKTTRDSNLELYRIIVMFLIVCHHYVVNSGLVSAMENNPLQYNSLFFYIMGMWGKIGINCFILITGYYMCTSSITIKKFLKLLFQIEFYNILIPVIFIIFGTRYSILDFIHLVLPIKSVSGEFTSCFLLFYLSIPFLNILVRDLSKILHLRLILLCLFAYSVMRFVPKAEVSLNYYSWFIVIFFVGSYLRKQNSKTSQKLWGGVTAAIIFLSIFSVFTILYLNSLFGTSIPCYCLVSDVHAPFAIAVAVSSFMFFKCLHIKYNRIINAIGSTTFGILLIHANNDDMRRWLWQDIFNCTGHFNDKFFGVYALGVVSLLFLICSIIDYIRIKTVEKWYMRILNNI